MLLVGFVVEKLFGVDFFEGVVGVYVGNGGVEWFNEIRFFGEDKVEVF